MSHSYLILWLLGCEVKRQSRWSFVHICKSFVLWKLQNFLCLAGLLIKINIFLLPNDIYYAARYCHLYPFATNKMNIFVQEMYLHFLSINLMEFGVFRLLLKKRRNSWSYLSFWAIIKKQDLSLYLWISRNMLMVFWKI